ncbi:ABC transporter permease subunit [Pseudoalteromonas mariniglutinosa]|uniref:ABC transporter permease subunit n=1 Tax=Pseudoalteromonas mariniglutinosa TaxID=206042 RepID=UPI00384B9C7E
MSSVNSSLWSIATKDRLELIRDRRFVLASALVILLSLATLLASFARLNAHQQDITAATERERASWMAQGDRDPHSAAHFAQWAFRPLMGMTLLDPGATDFSGSAVWMEAHARNPGDFRAVENRSMALSVGEISPSWIVQTLMPLLVFLLGAGCIAREREYGTLRLLLASGISIRNIVQQKTMSLLKTAVWLIGPLLVCAAVAFVLSPSEMNADAIIRFLLWIALQIGWLVIAALVAVTVSTHAQTTRQALMVLVGIWIISIPVLPRAASGLSEVTYPVPSGAQFWAETRTMISEGFDERGDQASRDKALRESLLEEYNVDNINALPVSYRGLRLDNSERFSNEVYAIRYRELDEQYQNQRMTMRVGALISPLIAMQNISAALAGTDNLHLRHFDEQAELERQKVVNALNGDLVANSVGVNSYTANEDLWGYFDVFKPEPLPISRALTSIVPDIIIFLLWLSGLFYLQSWSKKQLNKEFDK